VIEFEIHKIYIYIYEPAASDGPIVTHTCTRFHRSDYLALHCEHILSTIDFIMPSSWSQPYHSILRDSASEWLEAKGKGRHSVVESVAVKIKEEIEKEDAHEIEDLEDVSIHYTLKSFASITLFRKLRTGMRIMWPKKRKARNRRHNATQKTFNQ
jgi:hypothetical protein